MIAYIGVHIQVNESIQLIEGEMKKACVVLDDDKVREREIPVLLTILFNDIASGMLCFITMSLINLQILIVFVGDFNVSDQQVVIPIEQTWACIEVGAIDDMIIESEESLTIIFTTQNSNDYVSGNTTVVISDNDGKIKHLML